MINIIIFRKDYYIILIDNRFSKMKTKIITYSLLSAVIASMLMVSASADFKWLNYNERKVIQTLVHKFKCWEELTDEEEELVNTIKNKFESIEEKFNIFALSYFFFTSFSA